MTTNGITVRAITSLTITGTRIANVATRNRPWEAAPQTVVDMLIAYDGEREYQVSASITDYALMCEEPAPYRFGVDLPMAECERRESQRHNAPICRHAAEEFGLVLPPA